MLTTPREVTRRNRLKRLIVTADDFGIALPVNQAIDLAHRNGILSAASLMVAGDAVDDAVERARALPRLGVGLHLVMVDGKPVLPPELLPDLVDRSGNFPDDVFGLGVKLYFGRAARAQAEAEMRAQFEAFHRTGLPLDHVNAHHHFHFHPVLRDLLIKLAPEYRVRAIRVPLEPALRTWRITGDRGFSRLFNWLVVGSFARSLKRRAGAAGLASNDWQFGLSESGDMNAARVRRMVAALPEGITELYVHPAIERWSGWPDSYDSRGEFEALIDPEIAAILQRQGISPIPFAALFQDS